MKTLVREKTSILEKETNDYNHEKLTSYAILPCAFSASILLDKKSIEKTGSTLTQNMRSKDSCSTLHLACGTSRLHM